MKDIGLIVSELAKKAKAARTDVVDVASLKKITAPVDGTSFMVARTLFVWFPNDKTQDDGVTSVGLEGKPESVPGRFRRVTVSFRNSS